MYASAVSPVIPIPSKWRNNSENGKMIKEVAPNVHLLGVFAKKIFRKSFVFSVGEIRNYKLESETDRGEDPLAACGRMRGSHGEQ